MLSPCRPITSTCRWKGTVLWKLLSTNLTLFTFFIASSPPVPLHSKLLKQHLWIWSCLGVAVHFYRVLHLFPGALPQLWKSEEKRMEVGTHPTVRLHQIILEGFHPQTVLCPGRRIYVISIEKKHSTEKLESRNTYVKDSTLITLVNRRKTPA